MLKLPDIPTLGLCSMLASLAFCGVFVCLWVGQREERYYLHWAAGSLIYAATILAFNHISAHTPLQDGLLYALLSASTVAVLTGARRFDGLSPFRPWLLLPVLCSGLGYMGLALAYGSDSAPCRIGGTCGSVLAMSLVGGVLAFGPAPQPSRGRRIAGAALLAYIPGFLVAIAAEAFGYAAVNMAAVIPLVSDQLLLAVLNLGLIAMPGERAQAILREAALRDPLTGAWNRAGLRLIGARLVARRPERRLLDRLRTRRDGGEPQVRGALGQATAVIAFDVDHFKAINDDHGHGVGDRVLAALAAEARNLAPEPEAFLVRLGGDEFAMVLPDKSLAEARWLADEIRRTIRLTPDLPVWTISLGVAAVEPGETDLSTVIERADRSLYRAKAEGRDRAAA